MRFSCFHNLFNFNPHSHAGSDLCKFRDAFRQGQNFNPHSHAGSDQQLLLSEKRSFHFNPHSHAGSDSIVKTVRISTSYFNPHSHAGSDPPALPPIFPAFMISIHTPTQGVTVAVGESLYVLLYFNPHSHAGSDSKNHIFS